MKEKPILFSGPMVRALLNGSKTQTRRVVKPQPPEWAKFPQQVGVPTDGLFEWTDREEDADDLMHWPDYGNPLRCPYGQPGDRLWVREAFAFTDAHEPEYIGSIEYRADNRCLAVDHGPITVDVPHKCDPTPFGGPWKPGIHMPRWANRITLEVTRIRVERLQGISEADAIAEGIELLNGRFTFNGGPHKSRTAAGSYRSLWESINSANRPSLPSNTRSKRYARVKAWREKHPDTTSWDANPWVWVVEFKRLEQPA